MKTSLNNINIRRWGALLPCVLVLGIGFTTMPDASAKKRAATPPPSGLVSVQFSDDCASATVESSRPIKNMVAVFNNDNWEDMEGLAGVRTYVVKVGQIASKSGLAIVSLYVDAHTARLQKDPLGIVPHNVGLGFECASRAA